MTNNYFIIAETIIYIHIWFEGTQNILDYVYKKNNIFLIRKHATWYRYIWNLEIKELKCKII